jgi:hypothetical protein
MIIFFCSFWFLLKKITKFKFYKIQKIKLKPVPTGFDSVQFGYFILKTKKLYCFLGFFGLSNGFNDGLGFGSIRLFYIFLTKSVWFG